MADAHADTDAAADYQAPEPNPELKKLDFLVGTWEQKGHMKPSQFGPGGPIGGTHKWEWFNEYFLKHSWSQELGEGVEYIGYEDARKGFYTHYFDNNGPYDEEGSTYEGKMSGKSAVFCGPARLTFTPSADGKTIKFTAEGGKKSRRQTLDAPDSDWFDWMEGTFTKLS